MRSAEKILLIAVLVSFAFFCTVVLTRVFQFETLPFLAPIAILESTATPVPEPVCPAKEYRDEVAPVLERWRDAFQIASEAPRISLPAPIADLQAAKRDFEAIAAHECLESARKSIVDGMNYTIDGFIAFLGRGPDEDVSRSFEMADTLLDGGLKEVLRLSNQQ